MAQNWGKLARGDGQLASTICTLLNNSLGKNLREYIADQSPSVLR